MPEPLVYGYLAGSVQDSLLFAKLGDALYCALIDVHERRRIPVGIRRGDRVLYRHSQLLALYEQHGAALAAGMQQAVSTALHRLATEPANY